MRTRPPRRGLAFLALLAAGAGRARAQSTAPVLAAPLAVQSVSSATATPVAVVAVATAEQARERFLEDLRQSYMDRQAKTPLPEVPVSTQSAERLGLQDLADQAAAVQAGRGDETLADYIDMVVLVASRLGVDPPESAIPVYRDRLRSKASVWPDSLLKIRAGLLAAAKQPNFHRRYVYVDGLAQNTTAEAAALAAAAAAEAAAKATMVASKTRRGSKRRKARKIQAPPEPAAPPSTVLDAIDWSKAEDLAAAAEEGASGWDDGHGRRARKARRRRRGRCYEWVRMALDKVGLWTDEYRAKVARKGDRRRPLRAYSFAWAMNVLEGDAQGEPLPAAKKVPLRRLDLRVDPLVIGSIVVFDRSVCGYDRRSGHIEIITSVDPLQASSYKFHQVKMECLIKAANSGQVHIYVPSLADRSTKL